MRVAWPKIMSDRRQAIRDYIVREFNPVEPIGNETQLVELGIVDSLAVFALIGFIHDEFGIEVDPDSVSYENFETVNAIEALVTACASRGGNPEPRR